MTMWQIPAIVLALLTWLLSPPTGLADVARREALRRQLTPKPTRSLTNLDVASLPPRPLPTVPAPPVEVAIPGTASSAAEAPKKEEASKKEGESAETHDEAWWRGRMTAARASLERNQLLFDALQSRINSLTADASARDDPAQRALLYEQRTRALAELDAMRELINSDKKAIEQIQEDVRKQGVPAGWIR
jgi:hypothetical protein